MLMLSSNALNSLKHWHLNSISGFKFLFVLRGHSHMTSHDEGRRVGQEVPLKSDFQACFCRRVVQKMGK